MLRKIRRQSATSESLLKSGSKWRREAVFKNKTLSWMFSGCKSRYRLDWEEQPSMVGGLCCLFLRKNCSEEGWNFSWPFKVKLDWMKLFTPIHQRELAYYKSVQVVSLNKYKSRYISESPLPTSKKVSYFFPVQRAIGVMPLYSKLNRSTGTPFDKPFT